MRNEDLFFGSTLLLAAAFVVSLFIGLKGCECLDGGLNQPCYPNSTCDNGFVCFNNGPRGVCVPQNPGDNLKDRL